MKKVIYIIISIIVTLIFSLSCVKETPLKRSSKLLDSNSNSNYVTNSCVGCSDNMIYVGRDNPGGNSYGCTDGPSSCYDGRDIAVHSSFWKSFVESVQSYTYSTWLLDSVNMNDIVDAVPDYADLFLGCKIGKYEMVYYSHSSLNKECAILIGDTSGTDINNHIASIVLLK
jgi:hypothetical protein